jgi:large subunit ribosomal protein L35
MGKKKQKKYKLKTHKASAKRFKKTGSGKIIRAKGNKGHLRRNRSKRAKRQLSKKIEVKGSKYKNNIRRLVPGIN